MSLRIRRGTNTQRTTVTLDLGEIAYTTDTKKLYVGDGITAGGVNILANSAGNGLEWNNTTQQLDYTGALGAALSNVVEDTTPQLGGNLDLNNKTINGTGTIDFTGNISATALGLTTGLTTNLPLNNHNITGTGSINITGDITASGSLTAANLGGALGLNGHDISGTGNISVTGNLSASGTITAASLGGNLSLNGYTLNGLGSINIGGVLTAVTYANTSMTLGSPNVQPLAVKSITSGGGIPEITLKTSKGTLASPTNTAPLDFLGGYKVEGLYSGTFKFGSAIITQWESDADLTDTNPKSKLYFLTGDNASGYNQASLDGTGMFTVPTLSVGDGTSTNPSIVFSTDGSMDTGFYHPGDGIICAATDSVERVRIDDGGMRVNGFMKVADCGGTLPSPPEAGMIVLDSGTFKGYTGSAWVNLN